MPRVNHTVTLVGPPRIVEPAEKILYNTTSGEVITIQGDRVVSIDKPLRRKHEPLALPVMNFGTKNDVTKPDDGPLALPEMKFDEIDD